MPTTVVSKWLVTTANACAARNHHRWQEFYLTARVVAHGRALTVATTCLDHARLLRGR